VQWMSDGSEQHARVVAAVLREAHTEIIFDCVILFVAFSVRHAIGKKVCSESRVLHIATILVCAVLHPASRFRKTSVLEKHASEVLNTLIAGILPMTCMRDFFVQQVGIEWQAS